MQVNATNSANSSDASVPPNELNGDSFIKLLLAQLKAQDPLSPMDPSQFVGQLVQFNTLEQIIQIRQTLEQISTASANTAAYGHNNIAGEN